MNPLLAEIEAKSLRQEELAPFNVGDSVSVHYRIKEGDKQRIQLFSGTVIRKSAGHGDINATFTVRRIVDGEGVERVFPIHSPKVAKVEVTRQGRVRRAKLYYLRDRVGKATKVKEKVRTRHDKEAGAN